MIADFISENAWIWQFVDKIHKNQQPAKGKKQLAQKQQTNKHVQNKWRGKKEEQPKETGICLFEI